jgi:hypothetical protein
MSNWDSDLDSRLDGDIDEVARAMTGQPASPEFSRRVLARIDQPSPHNEWRPMWIWSPVAALATVALAVFLLRVQWTSVTVQQQSTRTDAAAGQDSVVPGRAAGTTPGTASGSSQANPGSGNPMVAASGSRRTNTASGNQGVAASVLGRTSGGAIAQTIGTTRRSRAEELSDLIPPPLDVDPIRIDAMAATESIDVPRLGIDEIDVPAIGE